jgi:hypothetical protein
MNNLFHTEDCALSLLCRCCRARVCEQQLTKAERMKVPRDLWSYGYETRCHSSPIKQVKSYLRNFSIGYNLGIFNHFVHRLLRIRKDGGA